LKQDESFNKDGYIASRCFTCTTPENNIKDCLYQAVGFAYLEIIFSELTGIGISQELVNQLTNSNPSNQPQFFKHFDTVKAKDWILKIKRNEYLYETLINDYELAIVILIVYIICNRIYWI